MNPAFLLVAALGLPPALLALGLGPSVRSVLPRLLWLAPAPALGLSLLGPWLLPIPLAGWVFQLDEAGALLLAAAAALWMIAGAAVPGCFGQTPPSLSFCSCWLLTLTGSIGVFLAVDLVGFLVFYALVSLPAYGLIVAGGTPGSRRAGNVTLAFALLGENVLLIAFVLLAGGFSPAAPAVLLLILLGFGMKMALLPAHVWMPLAYSAAPVPAAAVLSGAAVKAGVIGLLRFLPWGEPLETAGPTLTVLGFGGAFFGVVVGVTQRDPKALLAYSSISQMGFLAAVIGMGMTAGDAGTALLVAFYAAHHVLAKGALFLALAAGRNRWLVLMPAAVVGLGLAGLPLTGGMLAKLAVKDPLGGGIAGMLAVAASSGTAMLLTVFLFRLADHARQSGCSGRRGLLPWLTGAACCLAFPWIFLGAAGLQVAEVLSPASLAKAAWPVLIGGIFALLLHRFRLPEIPAGDLIVLGKWIQGPWSLLVSGVRCGEPVLRRWPVAGLAVLALLLGLVVAFGVGKP